MWQRRQMNYYAEPCEWRADCQWTDAYTAYAIPLSQKSEIWRRCATQNLYSKCVDYVCRICTCAQRIPYNNKTQTNNNKTAEANSRIPCRVTKDLDCVFPIWITQCDRVCFTHNAVPLCDFSRPRHSTAGARHGIYELTLVVYRRPAGDLPVFDFFQLPRGVSRFAVRIFPATRGLSRRTRHCRRKAVAQ